MYRRRIRVFVWEIECWYTFANIFNCFRDIYKNFIRSVLNLVTFQHKILNLKLKNKDSFGYYPKYLPGINRKPLNVVVPKLGKKKR